MPRRSSRRRSANRAKHNAIRSGSRSTESVPEGPYADEFRYISGIASAPAHPAGGLELGYARVSTTKQGLERQLDALANTGLPDGRILRRQEDRCDRRPAWPNCSNTRPGDTVVACTLNRQR
ncbi:recombinase family protein [Nocardia sp. 2YAB30]